MFGYEKGTFTGGMRDGKMGLFEFANRGTIFLDEIGEMPLELQAKLLRIIENGEIKRLGSNKIIKSDVRILAATNRNLYEMVQEKTFRADLYYRLNVLNVNVPPLRDRVEDIQPLARYFVQLCNKKYGFTKHLTPEAVAVMEGYSWPGNVRELRNTVERMLVGTPSSIIDASAFTNPGGMPPPARKAAEKAPEEAAASDELLPYHQAVALYERRYMTSVLASCDGNIRAAAEKMELHLSTLYRKMEKLGL